MANINSKELERRIDSSKWLLNNRVAENEAEKMLKQVLINQVTIMESLKELIDTKNENENS
jgi:hypothetical protein